MRFGTKQLRGQVDESRSTKPLLTTYTDICGKLNSARTFRPQMRDDFE